jgi:hypothetical protein
MAMVADDPKMPFQWKWMQYYIKYNYLHLNMSCTDCQHFPGFKTLCVNGDHRVLLRFCRRQSDWLGRLLIKACFSDSSSDPDSVAVFRRWFWSDCTLLILYVTGTLIQTAEGKSILIPSQNLAQPINLQGLSVATPIAQPQIQQQTQNTVSNMLHLAQQQQTGGNQGNLLIGNLQLSPLCYEEPQLY